MTYIKAVEIYTPEQCLDNKALSKEFPEWGVDKIFDKTGIENRYIAKADESCSDMAVKACRKLFSTNTIDIDSIDFILLCTQSPDYLLPTTACLLQERLGLRRSVGALDYNLGCSGYIYGLSLAHGLIYSGQVNNVLLVTTEQYSKYINKKDKSVRTLFGDAATASLVSTSSNGSNAVGPFVFGTDGGGADCLMVPHGGNKNPINESSYIEQSDANNNVRTPLDLYMNGSEVFTFTLTVVPKIVNELLAKEGLSKNDIDYVIFHQANKFMLDILQKKCGFTNEQFLRSYQEYGNTVSNTIPIGLAEANQSKLFNHGDRILLVGFGVGLSWAATLIRWEGDSGHES